MSAPCASGGFDMWTIILAGLKRFGGWILAALFFFAMLRNTRKLGKAEAQADEAERRAGDREALAVRQINESRASHEREVETVKGAADAQANNAVLSDADVTKRLHDKWSRD